MAKVVSLRLDDELLEWATTYAESRGVSRTDLLIEGLRNFREDCERGVPEVRRAARERAQAIRGVGECPKSPRGHEWSSGESRACVHCGRCGRDNVVAGESGGFFAEATMARAELFSGLRAPKSVSVWGK